MHEKLIALPRPHFTPISHRFIALFQRIVKLREFHLAFPFYFSFFFFSFFFFVTPLPSYKSVGESAVEQTKLFEMFSVLSNVKRDNVQLERETEKWYLNSWIYGKFVEFYLFYRTINLPWTIECPLLSLLFLRIH